MGLLSKLFRRTKSNRQPSFRLDDDNSFHANSDILRGYEFSATLQLRTPLHVLGHHGELFEGPPSEAPVYGDKSQGLWVPKTHSYRELGIDLDEIEEGTHASDIGSVKAGYYLPFLKAFRRIVESEASVPDQLARIQELRNKSPQFAEVYDTHCRSNPDFPESYFYHQLENIEGVGPALAKRLFDAGFYDQRLVHGATEADLHRIHGIGLSLAKRLSNRET